MRQIKNLAVLLTCFNRRETTLKCLRSLYGQTLSDDIEIETYLVDDGCTDGTGDAVKKQFPNVNIIQSDGNLFWCGGMRLAWAEAMRVGYDYYIWLNDDTILYPGAIKTLIKTVCDLKKVERTAGIVVGSTCDPETGKLTYGGVVRTSKWRPLNLRKVVPSDKLLKCDTMNGNCVLIPKEVANDVGNISLEFTHTMGDIDYGFRAFRKGVPIYVAPGNIGECSNNPAARWTNPEVNFKERLREVRSPKGLPPDEWSIFVRRHAGILWPYYIFTLRLRTMFPYLWCWRRKIFG